MLASGDFARNSAVRITSIVQQHLLLSVAPTFCHDIFTTRPIATKGHSRTAPPRAVRRTIIVEPAAPLPPPPTFRAQLEAPGPITNRRPSRDALPRGRAAAADRDARSKAPSVARRTDPSNSPRILPAASPTPRRAAGSSNSTAPSALIAVTDSLRRR